MRKYVKIYRLLVELFLVCLFLMVFGCSGSDANQLARNAQQEEEILHTKDIAHVFLRALVEEDYSAIRPLLTKVASQPPHSPEAFGPELALKDEIRLWLKKHNLGGKHFKSFGIGGGRPEGMLAGSRRTYVGALFFDDSGRVRFDITLVQMQVPTGTDSPFGGAWRVEEFTLSHFELDLPEGKNPEK